MALAVPSLEAIEEMPKIDLHFHLDGGVPKDILTNLAEKHDIPLDPKKLEHYPNAGPFDAHNDPDGFWQFLDCFDLSLALMQSPETIYDTTLEVIRDLARQNIIYVEMRIAPNYHTKGGHSMEEMVNAVLRAMTDAEAETGTKSRLILAIPREIATAGDLSGNGNTAEDIVAVARQFERQGVVGIDLVCDEFTYPPEPYIDLFRSTIKTTILIVEKKNADLC